MGDLDIQASKKINFLKNILSIFDKILNNYYGYISLNEELHNSTIRLADILRYVNRIKGIPMNYADTVNEFTVV